MAKLFCVVVGVGTVFPVDIDIRETGGDLKDKIKAKNPNMIYFDAALLTLYLAKHGGSWLAIDSKDMKAVRRGETPETIQELMKEPMEESRELEYQAYMGTRFVTIEDDIHILVELPAESDHFKDNLFGGFVDSLLDSGFALQAPWSYLQSLLGIDNATQNKKKI